jgi:tetratricopeptide (TPR) repeat protein
VRRAFLDKALTLSPAAYKHLELEEVHDQLEDILCKLARSFVFLTEYELRQQTERQLENARKAAEKAGTPQKQAGAKFAIKTNLLDGRDQLKTGVQLLKAGQWDRAIQNLEYVRDLDPDNPIPQAHIVYARFMKNPDFGGPDALKALDALLAAHRTCDVALTYAGLVHRKLGNKVEAQAKLREALRINPKNADARAAMDQAR